MEIVTITVPSPLGSLNVALDEHKIVSLAISNRKLNDKGGLPLSHMSKQIRVRLKKQMADYFKNASTAPDLILAPQGTVFQQAVWQELQQIPAGETRTYGEIAAHLSSSARAVGNACRRNPIVIIIPCHRVISAQGIGGYAGQTAGKQLAIKRWLLRHEGVVI